MPVRPDARRHFFFCDGCPRNRSAAPNRHDESCELKRHTSGGLVASPFMATWSLGTSRRDESRPYAFRSGVSVKFEILIMAALRAGPGMTLAFAMITMVMLHRPGRNPESPPKLRSGSVL